MNEKYFQILVVFIGLTGALNLVATAYVSTEYGQEEAFGKSTCSMIVEEERRATRYWHNEYANMTQDYYDLKERVKRIDDYAQKNGKVK